MRLSSDEIRDHRVVELRQYKIANDKRDAMIALFETQFVSTQEAVGMALIGQFRDLDDPNRFTWIRSFPDMEKRALGLNAFYFGDHWRAHRDAANSMLEDNDNVLLLKPIGDEIIDLTPSQEPSLIVINIHYLWKDPTDRFVDFFVDQLKPHLSKCGLPVLGAYVPERSENTFPQLPARQAENVFVWITRSASEQAHKAAMTALSADDDVMTRLADFEERRTQILRLEPTASSRLS